MPSGGLWAAQKRTGLGEIIAKFGGARTWSGKAQEERQKAEGRRAEGIGKGDREKDSPRSPRRTRRSEEILTGWGNLVDGMGLAGKIAGGIGLAE